MIYNGKGELGSVATLPSDLLVAAEVAVHNSRRSITGNSGSDDGTTPSASWGVHAPGQYSYRLVALSRRLPRCQFQSQASDPLRADPRARPVRRLLHGRPPGRAQHADGRLEAQRHRHLVRSTDFAAGARDGDATSRADRDRIHDV